VTTTAGSDWIGEFLARERLPASYRELIDRLHAPLAADIAAHAAAADGLLTVGLCGAQGSGKSTLVASLKVLLEHAGLPTAVLSIDDLYLTRAGRERLAREVHPLLVTRGVPGTHDVGLGLETLDALAKGGAVALPSFDKGCDDRRPRTEWPVFPGGARVAILEGWCVGAAPQDDAALVEPVNALERDEDPQGIWRGYVNARLRDEYRPLFARLSPLVLLRAPSFECVRSWRLEQEHKLRDRVRAAGGDESRVMDDAGVTRFIAHYERLTRHILQEMPGRADQVLPIDAQRRPA
jgi:D-glycerate 3-kinase